MAFPIRGGDPVWRSRAHAAPHTIAFCGRVAVMGTISQVPGATAADTELMEKIVRTFGPLLRSVDLNTDTAAMAAFLAALVANESGGDTNAKRFEPAVFVSIGKVLLGRTPNYGGIGKPAFLRFIDPSSCDPAGRVPANFSASLQRLDSVATSWGLTQVMGYHTVRLADAPGWRSIEQLQTPAGCLQFTMLLLGEFSQRFHLDINKDPDKFFRCWNCGRPDGTTHDPAYVPNGLVRMNIYRELVAK